MMNQFEEWFSQNEELISGGIIAIGLILFLAMLVVFQQNNRDENKNSCESIGGRYELVDKTYSGNVPVSIYGCVK